MNGWAIVVVGVVAAYGVLVTTVLRLHVALQKDDKRRRAWEQGVERRLDTHEQTHRWTGDIDRRQGERIAAIEAQMHLRDLRIAESANAIDMLAPHVARLVKLAAKTAPVPTPADPPAPAQPEPTPTPTPPASTKRGGASRFVEHTLVSFAPPPSPAGSGFQLEEPAPSSRAVRPPHPPPRSVRPPLPPPVAPASATARDALDDDPATLVLGDARGVRAAIGDALNASAPAPACPRPRVDTLRGAASPVAPLTGLLTRARVPEDNRPTIETPPPVHADGGKPA